MFKKKKRKKLRSCLLDNLLKVMQKYYKGVLVEEEERGERRGPAGQKLSRYIKTIFQ